MDDALFFQLSQTICGNKVSFVTILDLFSWFLNCSASSSLLLPMSELMLYPSFGWYFKSGPTESKHFQLRVKRDIYGYCQGIRITLGQRKAVIAVSNADCDGGVHVQGTLEVAFMQQSAKEKCVWGENCNLKKWKECSHISWSIPRGLKQLTAERSWKLKPDHVIWRNSSAIKSTSIWTNQISSWLMKLSGSCLFPWLDYKRNWHVGIMTRRPLICRFDANLYCGLELAARGVWILSIHCVHKWTSSYPASSTMTRVMTQCVWTRKEEDFYSSAKKIVWKRNKGRSRESLFLYRPWLSESFALAVKVWMS